MMVVGAFGCCNGELGVTIPTTATASEQYVDRADSPCPQRSLLRHMPGYRCSYLPSPLDPDN
jgi:hypothetical protein